MTLHDDQLSTICRKLGCHYLASRQHIHELADEIERLRALLERTKPMVSSDIRDPSLLGEIREVLGSVCDTGDN